MQYPVFYQEQGIMHSNGFFRGSDFNNSEFCNPESDFGVIPKKE